MFSKYSMLSSPILLPDKFKVFKFLPTFDNNNKFLLLMQFSLKFNSSKFSKEFNFSKLYIFDCFRFILITYGYKSASSSSIS